MIIFSIIFTKYYYLKNIPWVQFKKLQILFDVLIFIILSQIISMKNELIFGIVLALIAGAALFNYDGTTINNKLGLFQKFKADYGKNYNLEETIYRFSVFIKTLEKIEKHNADSTQTYTMGVTQFADMTQEQFIDKILMKDLSSRLDSNVEKVQPRGIEAPTEVDWRNKNVLTPVKNQGNCGSCWAFSTTGALESNIAVAKGTLFSFSEQQLVDCCGSKGFQCQGCSGAWPEWAFNYINNAGIVLESEYPYTAKQAACKATTTAKKYLNSAKPWSMLSGGAIKQSLATTGPVSICVDASNWSTYRSGVFSNCGGSNLNHAVTLVGYNADGAWLVRNSWGVSWGAQGHITLAAGNTCGLQNHALIPNLA